MQFEPSKRAPRGEGSCAGGGGGGKSSLHRVLWAMHPEVRLPGRVPFYRLHKGAVRHSSDTSTLIFLRKIFQSSVRLMEKEASLTWLGLG